jgi:1-deoxyxylulose-5-phosphate synthase
MIPWSPQARGLLARKPTSEEKTPRAEADQFAQHYQAFQDSAIVDAVVRTAERRGIKPAQVALAWLLSKPVLTAPIVGASKLHHLEDAADAVEIRLTTEEIEALECLYQPKPSFGITPPFRYPKPGAVHDR